MRRSCGNLLRRSCRDSDEISQEVLLYDLVRRSCGDLDEIIPVVLHKAVAEVSKIGHYRRGELL